MATRGDRDHAAEGERRSFHAVRPDAFNYVWDNSIEPELEGTPLALGRQHGHEAPPRRNDALPAGWRGGVAVLSGRHPLGAGRQRGLRNGHRDGYRSLVAPLGAARFPRRRSPVPRSAWRATTSRGDRLTSRRAWPPTSWRRPNRRCGRRCSTSEKTTASCERRLTPYVASRWICASTRWWMPPTGW